MIIWYTIQEKMQDWACITTRTEHTRENRAWSMTEHSSMTRIDIDEFDDSIYESTRCFHTSGITLALSEECRKTGVEMIKRFKEKGTLISFDVNFRLNLWSGEEARKCIEGILPYVDIFFCSEDTARLTFGKERQCKRDHGKLCS